MTDYLNDLEKGALAAYLKSGIVLADRTVLEITYTDLNTGENA